MTFIKIGSGTTNKKGYAIMNKNKQNQKITHSYTGTGAGKTQIIAKIKNTEITTTPTDIYDTTWYDNATKDNTSKWTWNNLEHSIIEEGCLVTGTLSKDISPLNGNSTIWVSSNQNVCFEIDIKNINATSAFITMFNLPPYSVPLDTEVFKRIKLILSSYNLDYYVDDVLITSKTVETKPYVLYSINIYADNSIVFKNAKYYPI